MAHFFQRALRAAASSISSVARNIIPALRRRSEELRRLNERLQAEIKARHAIEAALESAEEKYRGILEYSSEGIFQTTAEGRFLTANNALARICGYDSPEELRHLISDIGTQLYVDADRRAEFKGRIAESTKVQGFESEIYHKSGAKLWISENARAVYDESRKFLHYEGTVQDITTSRKNAAELQKTRAELMEANRQTEALTTVVQSADTALAALNLQAKALSELLRKSKIPQLSKAAALIKEKGDTFLEYLARDPEGKIFPHYLVELSAHLSANHAELLQKMEQIKTQLEYAKEIVAPQQNCAKIAGVHQAVNLSEVVEDALRLNSGGFSRHRIEVVREYDPSATANLDKSKVLQIVINLVRNAEYSCAQSVKDRKQVTVSVLNEGDRIKISVADNGIGIPSENMVRIFKNGFTTKKNGHGFGLHHCATAAKELGGTLKAHSDGDGQGAIFTLDLPIRV